MSEFRAQFSRRQFLNRLAVAMGGAAVATPLLAACQPKVVEVEKVVKETVVVEKEVEKEVEKVVKETVVVEKEVQKVQDVAVLRFWHHWSAARHQPLQETVKEFEARNPGIRVVENMLPQQQVTEKILTAIAAGDAPNVAMLIRRKLQTFAAEGALLGLDEYLARDGIDGSKEYYPSEWELCLWQDKAYALPLTEGTRFLFLNAEMFEQAGLDPDKPPTSWDELEVAASKMTTFKDDRLDVIGFDAASYQLYFLGVLNGGIQTISDDRRSITVEVPEMIEGLRWAVDFTDRVNKGYAGVQAFMSQSGAWEQHPLLSNKLAIGGDAHYFIFFIQEYAPDLKYRICKHPAGPSGERPVAVNYPGWSYIIPTGVPDQEESWVLEEYMCHGDGLKDFMQRTSRPTPMMKHNADPWYTDNVPYWAEFLEMMETAAPVRLSPVFEAFDTKLVEAQQKALFHKETPEQALAWAQVEGQKLLDEFWKAQG